MRLDEQFDMAGQRQYRPGACGQYGARNFVRIGHLAIAGRQVWGDHALHATKELLVLYFLRGKSHQCLEGGLVAEGAGTALLKNFGADEPLNQAENIGIGGALDLAQQARLRCGEKRQAIHVRESIGQELAGEIEFPPLHERPAEPWTADMLAAQVGMSRSVFAERFSALVGEPPMHYLTVWRMHVAAQQLREGPASIAQVAFKVGYESEAAFSRAFKRPFDPSPGSGAGSCD